MPDYEDVDIGGTIYVTFTVNGSSRTTTSTQTRARFRWDTTPPSPAPPPWDAAEAKRLYRRLSKLFHPDLNKRPIMGRQPHEWMSVLNLVMERHDMKTLLALAERFSPG